MNDSTARCTGTIPADDRTIRAALVRKRLRRYRDRDDSLLVHELGLAHARSRIDVAVISGVLHGYEIKSERDKLSRLPAQLNVYCQSLQKLTFVVAERHLESVLNKAPRWCGVLIARQGTRGSIDFEMVQRAERNPRVDLFVMAHLLWRDEARAILAAHGAGKSALRSPRALLYRELAGGVSEARLTALIKDAMMRRRAWRDHPSPV